MRPITSKITRTSKWRVTALTLALAALVAFVMVTPWPAAAQSAPSAPTNLEFTRFNGNDEDGFVGVLEWDYDDADDGYVMEKRRGTTDDWECVVAGGYPDGSTISISTAKGGKLEGADDWYFQVFSINEQAFSYIDEVTCDENAMWGYVRDPDPDEGYTFSAAAQVGPITIIDPDNVGVEDLATPTNFQVVTARHGRVKVTWDLANDNGATTGYILMREYLGTSGVDMCVFWPLSLWGYFTDRYVSAYDTASDANKYTYRLYPINEKYDRTQCFVENPPSPPSTPAEATATLTTSTKINVVNGKLTYSNPPAPQDFALVAYYSGTPGIGSRIAASWDSISDIPAYQVRYKDDDPASDWNTPVTISSTGFPQMWGANGTEYDAPDHWYFTQSGDITTGTTYIFQAGACDNTDCDNVTWTASESATGAAEPDN